MNKPETKKSACAICGKMFPLAELVRGEVLRPEILEHLRLQHPQWTSTDFICQADLTTFRMAYVQGLLQSEKGELTSLEQEVLRSIREHEVVSNNIDQEFEKEWSLGERLADRIASFGGSWRFLMTFAFFLAVWILLNSITMWWKPIDGFPYILLNLMLSCLAANQAPVIMMSQNRQEAKDRLRSQHDYKVNLKAELEIRQLHDKLDHILSHQWDRLVQIQQVQLEMLMELRSKK